MTRPTSRLIDVPCEVCNGDDRGCKHCDWTGSVKMTEQEWEEQNPDLAPHAHWENDREQFHSDLGLGATDYEPDFPEY